MAGRLLTVVAPAATVFDLTDLETVKDELELDSGEADERLTRYITEASKWIASYCRQVFARETVAETFRNNEGVECLVLTRRPVVSITSIVEDEETLVAADYEADLAAGLLYRVNDDSRSSWSWSKIVVTYVAGYTLPTAAPPELSDACIELVKLKQSGQTRDPLLRSVSTSGVLAEEYWVGGVGDDGIPPRVKSLLAPFRNILV